MQNICRVIANALPVLPVRRLLFVLALILSAQLSPPAFSQAPKPTGILALILIRDALSALNQANWTGNYTVLRDYASPNFARNNDPVRLTAIFQPIRAQALNLAPTLYLAPKITKAELNKQGTRLQLKGFFPSKPKQIHFDLIFEPIVNRWRLFGIGVWSVEAKVAKANPVGRLKIDGVKASPALIQPPANNVDVQRFQPVKGGIPTPKSRPGG